MTATKFWFRRVPDQASGITAGSSGRGTLGDGAFPRSKLSLMVDGFMDNPIIPLLPTLFKPY